MKAGKAPMRTFGDLLQFYHQKEPEPGAATPPTAAVPQTVAVDPPHATAAQPVEQPVKQPAKETVAAVEQKPAIAAEETSATQDGE